MGSRLNYNGEQPMIGTTLPRQNSVFSLTFDEFQNTLSGGIVKDFGSMNMDELLKNIWSAEESGNSVINHNNNNGLLFGLGEGGLQRQGSLTLPRTISQKRVDDVWKELMNEDDIGNGSEIPQRQLTLGEMTLEEFLLRAGVVREEPQQQPVVESQLNNFNNNGFYGFSSNGFVPNQPLGVAVRPDLLPIQPQPLQMQQQPQERPFPKHTTIAFDANNRQEVKPTILGVRDNPMNNGLLQGVDFKTVGGVSPGGGQMSPDLTTPKSGMDASLSPVVPYMFGRARKTGAVLEKVIERRQKRMIKNRESAARSRARKQAYTLELEAEVAQLKELNEELQRKQIEIIEKQKKQLMEPLRQPMGCKRQCLRRTLTGPW